MPTALRAFFARHRRFVAFCAVGASGVVVNLAVFWLVLAMLDDGSGERSWLVDNTAVVAGWLVSVASNFALNDRLTFRSASGPGYSARWPQRLLRYYLSASVAGAIQLGVFNALLWAVQGAWLGDPLREVAAGQGVVAWLFATSLHFRRTMANLVGIGFGTIANYVLAKYWVFKIAPDDDAAASNPQG